MSGLSHPATTGKEGVKRDAPGARALFQAAGSLGTIRKALGTLSLSLHTATCSVSLRAEGSEERRQEGHFPQWDA